VICLRAAYCLESRRIRCAADFHAQPPRFVPLRLLESVRTSVLFRRPEFFKPVGPPDELIFGHGDVQRSAAVDHALDDQTGQRGVRVLAVAVKKYDSVTNWERESPAVNADGFLQSVLVAAFEGNTDWATYCTSVTAAFLTRARISARFVSDGSSVN
jgi:hypothetical protein